MFKVNSDKPVSIFRWMTRKFERSKNRAFRNTKPTHLEITSSQFLCQAFWFFFSKISSRQKKIKIDCLTTYSSLAKWRPCLRVSKKLTMLSVKFNRWTLFNNFNSLNKSNGFPPCQQSSFSPLPATLHRYLSNHDVSSTHRVPNDRGIATVQAA